VTNKDVDDLVLSERILKCYKKVKGIYGYRRITLWLNKHFDECVNHKRVYRLMNVIGIKSRIRKKRKIYVDPDEQIKLPNILARKFSAQLPNEKWVTDITYLHYGKRRLYLSVIYDLYNNEVVSYRISDKNDLKLVTDTVKSAYKRVSAKGVLLHSDQGSQYMATQYHNLLKRYNIQASMSRRGNCLDNAAIESFFGHLKSELIYLNNYKDKQQLIKDVTQYIKFYNNQRIQAKLNKMSPIEYRRNQKIA